MAHDDGEKVIRYLRLQKAAGSVGLALYAVGTRFYIGALAATDRGSHKVLDSLDGVEGFVMGTALACAVGLRIGDDRFTPRFPERYGAPGDAPPPFRPVDMPTETAGPPARRKVTRAQKNYALDPVTFKKIGPKAMFIAVLEENGPGAVMSEVQLRRGAAAMFTGPQPTAKSARSCLSGMCNPNNQPQCAPVPPLTRIYEDGEKWYSLNAAARNGGGDGRTG